MSVFNHPLARNVMAGIETSEYFRRAANLSEDAPAPQKADAFYELWQGIRAVCSQYRTAKSGLLEEIFKDTQSIDPAKVRKLRELEIKCAVATDLYALTSDNNRTRNAAEGRVSNVIRGRLPVLQGTTIGAQLERMFEQDDARERVHIGYDRHLN
jgi:hypothetical protein